MFALGCRDGLSQKTGAFVVSEKLSSAQVVARKTAAALLANSCCEANQANQGMQSGLRKAYGLCCLDNFHHLSQYGVRRHRWTRSSTVALKLL